MRLIFRTSLILIVCNFMLVIAITQAKSVHLRTGASDPGWIVYPISRDNDYIGEGFMLMRPDGSESLELPLHIPMEAGRYSLSRDGNKIAYATNHNDIAVLYVDSGANEIFMTQPDDYNYYDPDWAQDGSLIMLGRYNQRNGVTEVRTVDLESDYGAMEQPSDERYVYSAQRVEASIGPVYRTDLRRGQVINLTQGFDLQGVDIQPGLHTIAFGQRKQQYGTWFVELYLMDTMHTITEDVQIMPTQDFRRFFLSPDGGRVLYMGCSQTCVLRLIEVSDQSVETLPISLSYDGKMVWSPDGQSIAFVAAGAQQVCVYYLDSGGLNCLEAYLNESLWGTLSWWQPQSVD